MLVYSPSPSPRLDYILNFLSGYFHHTFCHTSNVDEFKNAQEARINYSAAPVTKNELWIKPDSLLFEKGIKEINPQTFQHANGYVAFTISQPDKEFDLFASMFYLLSRYEEYLPHEKDLYGRFAHENSLAYRKRFLHLPLINIWLEDLRQSLLVLYPELPLAKRPFTFIPTYDIDIAWSYIHKEALIHIGGIVKSITKRDISSVIERLKVITGFQKDPFDVYDWLAQLHRDHKLNSIYFFHVGVSRNNYDKNISVQNVHLRELIKNTSISNKVGLHPSWQSGDDPSLLSKEKNSLEKITGKEISTSRQHYIRMTLPETYRALIDAGISEDYSMGYGSINGFRASIAAPFYWYDLETEKTTTLKIYPFCFMDANSFFEQKNTPEEGLKGIIKFYDLVKRWGGTFICIWHNSFLGSDNLYKGWKDIYRQFIENHNRHAGNKPMS